MLYTVLMTVSIDTLKVSKKLRGAGFKKEQAEALLESLVLSSDMVLSRKDLEAAINKLKAELVMWMIGLQIANAALVVSLLG